MKMYNSTVENIMKRIEAYHTSWNDNICQQPTSYLSRFLINRSPTHGGLIEVNIDRTVVPVLDEIKFFEFIEMPIAAPLVQFNSRAGKYVNLFNKVVNVVLLHNKILCSLSDKERLLFKEHIMQMDRKISPGMFRITYQDEMTDAFISDCLLHLVELQDFVNIYKIINMEVVKLFEDISNSFLQNISIRTLSTLDKFKRLLKESRNANVLKIGESYKRVIEYIITIYDGFESHLNTNEMSTRWTKYIQKIDGLAEYSILNSAQNTLNGIFELLNGRNNMKPDSIISIDITLDDRKIEFEPPLEHVVDAIQLIYDDLIKSIKIFPRLIKKFDLQSSEDIREFYEIVNDDIECREIYYQINAVVEHLLEKVNDYIEMWLLFRIVWEIDVDKFMSKLEAKGMDLKEFENSMMKYYDVANQVMMQDTIVVISFLTFDCSKLKNCVLEFIEMWKKGYKHTLCATMIKKLEKHNDTLTTRIKLLNEQPTNAAELDALLKLHEMSLREFKKREEEMEEIRNYYKYLEKYKILAPATLINNYESMPKNWAWYCRRLREIDDELYNFKEQFKME
jgi:dynein heavy chain